MSAEARVGADEQAPIPPGVSIAVVPWDDAAAARLRADQQAELALLYDDAGDLTRYLPAEQMLATVALSVDGAPQGTLSLAGSTRAIRGALEACGGG